MTPEIDPALDPALVADVDGRLVRPDVAALLARFRAHRIPPYAELEVAAARQMVEDSIALQAPPTAVAEVRDLVVDTRDQPTRVRLYRPAKGAGQVLIVYAHGGGWVTGSVEIADGWCRDLAAATGHMVASVDYRRSPEAVFPEPLDDVTASVRVLEGRREELGVDPARLVIAGDSAGGQLVAAATLALRDVVTDQILLYPALAPPAGDRFASYARNTDDPVLSSADMTWFWEQYLGAGADPTDQRVSLLQATDLNDMPRTFLVTCGLDVLRDEGHAYAAALTSAGTEVMHVDHPGLTHGYLWMSRHLSLARETAREIAVWLEGRQHPC